VTLSIVIAGCTWMLMPPSPSIIPATKKTPRRPKEDVRVSRPLPYGAEFSNIHFDLYFKHRNLEGAYSAYDRLVHDFFRGKPKDGYLEFDVRAGRSDGFCAFIGASVFLATCPGLTGRPTDERFGFCLGP
jgi:hypothetical protein